MGLFTIEPAILLSVIRTRMIKKVRIVTVKQVSDGMIKYELVAADC